MSTRRVALAPVFRSETQLAILAAAYLQPGRRFSINDLVARAGRPQSTVAREVDRLSSAGWLESAMVDGRRMVWADGDAVIYSAFRDLLLVTVGPKPVLEDALKDVRGIEMAYIFGSWAARAAGDPGPLPQDVDLIVIGDVDVAEVRDRAEHASAMLFRDVNPVVFSATEWGNENSGFLRELRRRPLTRLDLPVSS